MQQQVSEGVTGSGHDHEFTCPDCGGHSFTTVQHDDAFEYGAGESPVTLHAKVPVHCCDSCDFEFLGREGRLARHEAVCRHLEVLTPTEIRRIRKRHEMSRAAFAEITGFGEATLNRWERGAVIQNRANDRYLRLLESPEVVQRLQNLDHGTPIPDPPPGDPVEGTVFAGQVLRDSPAVRKQQAAFRLPVN